MTWLCRDVLGDYFFSESPDHTLTVWFPDGEGWTESVYVDATEMLAHESSAREVLAPWLSKSETTSA